jgi:hypothetical protein
LIDIPETLEDVLRINPDTPMAIIRVDEWPPGADVTTTGDKTSCRQLMREEVSVNARARARETHYHILYLPFDGTSQLVSSIPLPRTRTHLKVSAARTLS